MNIVASLISTSTNMLPYGYVFFFFLDQVLKEYDLCSQLLLSLLLLLFNDLRKHTQLSSLRVFFSYTEEGRKFNRSSSSINIIDFVI